MIEEKSTSTKTRKVLNWIKVTKVDMLKDLERNGTAYDKIIDYIEALDSEIMTFSSGYEPEDEKACILGKRIVKEGEIVDSQHGGGYLYADLVRWRGILVFVDQSTETIIDISIKDAEKFEGEVQKIIDEEGEESLFYSPENHDKWILE